MNLGFTLDFSFTLSDDTTLIFFRKDTIVASGEVSITDLAMESALTQNLPNPYLPTLPDCLYLCVHILSLPLSSPPSMPSYFTLVPPGYLYPYASAYPYLSTSGSGYKYLSLSLYLYFSPSPSPSMYLYPSPYISLLEGPSLSPSPSLHFLRLFICIHFRLCIFSVSVSKYCCSYSLYLIFFIMFFAYFLVSMVYIVYFICIFVHETITIYIMCILL